MRREKVSHVTVSRAWGEKGKVSHVTVSGGWRAKVKVSHAEFANTTPIPEVKPK